MHKQFEILLDKHIVDTYERAIIYGFKVLHSLDAERVNGSCDNHSDG